jgi:1-acyl-sn-glycerol-3-phosphate acyltransferase
MQLLLALAFLSLASAGLTYYFSGLYASLANLWMPLLFWMGYFLSFVIVFVLFAVVVSFFVDLKKPQKHVNRFAYWVMKEIAWNGMLFSRAKVRYVNKEKIPFSERCLYICNHVSGYDHLAIFGILPTTVVSITKVENENIFVAGKWMHLAGFLPLNRENPFEGLRTIARAIDYVKNDEASVAVSPEGTRSKDGALLPFREGAFRIATKTGCPVVVLRIEGTSLVKKNFPWRKTPITVTVLDVIRKDRYEGQTTVDLSDQVHDLLASSYL